jgi:phosphoglycerate dehydrogenase-like enzyme/predicted dehydrogenase
MANPPRALVVGASETAELLHLPLLARLRDIGRLELVEICDLRLESARAARNKFGFARDGGDAATAIARDDIDLVYCFGSARMHHALGLAALSAGKHLFVEKPIAPSYADAIELADAARQRELIAAGGHNRRFLSAFDRIRAASGSAGWTFTQAVFDKDAYGQPAPFGAASWLSGNGIHALDALLFMMGGLPEWLSAQAGGADTVSAVFTALMRWPNGAQAVLMCNNEAGARREEYAFHAPGESWRVTDAGLNIERDGTTILVDRPRAPESFVAEHGAFLDAVAKGVPPRHSLAALAPSLFLAELIEAGHHGPVRLPPSRTAAVPASRDHGVLVAHSERLRTMLGEMPSNWQLVSLEEIEGSPAPRHDISAAILGPGGPPLADSTLDKLPNLVVAGVAGLSLHRYGPERLLDRGITLVNASQAYAESVAEFALGLAILGRRRAFESSRAMRLGGWGTTLPQIGIRGATLAAARRLRPIVATLGIEPELRRAWQRNARLARLAPILAPPSRDLAGALVGLIGWGANARALTRRLVAAGASVIVHSEHASAKEIRAAGASPAPFASVLAADIVSLHRGLTPETRHCIGGPELARLRTGAVLINVARGALIEPAALIARLERGDMLACLDTFDEEPLPRRHPLRRMPNVFLTSHIAGGSRDMHAAAAREVIAKIAAHLDGSGAEPVTAARLAVMT